MKKLMLLFVFVFLGAVGLNAQTTFTGGGDGNSWSDGANWSTASVPSSGDDIYIPSGYDCVIDVSAVTVHNITVDAGASLSRGFGGLTTNATVNVTGNIACDGTIGLGGQLDRLTFNFDGADQSISGSGTFDVFAFKKNTIVAPTTNLTLSMNIVLRTTSNALNSFKNGGIFNVTVNNTVDVTSGYISIDNLGAASGGTGSLTINAAGIVNVAKYIDVFSDNTTNPGHVSFLVKNGATLNVPAINFKPSVVAPNGASFTLLAGSKLYLTGATPFNTYSGLNNSIIMSGDVHFSAAGDQTISNILDYNNIYFEGSGVKTTGGLNVNNSIAFLGGTATLSGALNYFGSCTLAYTGTNAQTTGSELTNIPANILINNTSGVTLNKDVDLTGTLTFVAGNLNTTSLYGVTVTGITNVLNESSSHYLIGNLRQNIGTNPGAGNYLGLVTDGAISGTSILATRVTGQAQTVGGNSSIKRYWNLNGSNITYNGGITLNWLANEAAGMQMSNAIIFEYYPLAPHFIFMNDQNGLAATLSGDSYSLSSTLPASVVNSSSVTYTVGDKNSPLPV
ncbi:MAG: G8 domain-containing protein, partial [Bacteroidota bacterium]|nr:G8 domain-containing protein [Bacteroidota bacterium]